MLEKPSFLHILCSWDHWQWLVTIDTNPCSTTVYADITHCEMCVCTYIRTYVCGCSFTFQLSPSSLLPPPPLPSPTCVESTMTHPSRSLPSTMKTHMWMDRTGTSTSDAPSSPSSSRCQSMLSLNPQSEQSPLYIVHTDMYTYYCTCYIQHIHV